MNENFLNLHVLVTTSVANPNRDDTGAPKQVTYGGVARQRMSSQAMTRSKRLAYELAAGGDQITWRAKGGMVTLATTMATDLALQSGQPLTAAERTALQVLLATGVNALVINTAWLGEQISSHFCLSRKQRGHSLLLNCKRLKAVGRLRQR